MDIYGPLLRSVIKPFWERGIRRRPILDLYAQLAESQWYSLDRLHDMQSAALRSLTQHAYDNVPFYRQLFGAAGVGRDDIRRPEDLLKLPVLRRSDLQGKDRKATSGPPLTISKQTSGTTGEPLVFGFEEASQHWRLAMKMRGYEWAGYRTGDRVVHFWGARLPTPPPFQTRMKVALDRAMHREVVVPCDVMSEARLAETVRRIEQVQPRALVCYAQAGAELARFINRNGLRTWESMSVICGAERLMPRDRADLAEAFGPEVFDTYGCREVMLIGAECERHKGHHVSMENLVVEIVVTEPDGTQRHASPGETGEVVFTDLHNYAMPFIRYANGDIAVAGDTKRCGCGRALPRIDSVQGRTSETLRDGNGAAISGLAISFLIHDISTAVRQFQAVQHKDRSVSINLLLHHTVPNTRLDEVRLNATRLLQGVDVRINTVSEFPRSAAGKHRLVVVER